MGGEAKTSKRGTFLEDNNLTQQDEITQCYMNESITTDEVNRGKKKHAAAAADILNYTILKTLPGETVKTITNLYNKIWSA